MSPFNRFLPIALCALWIAACSHDVIVPALPDSSRFVPTLPTSAEFQDSDLTRLIPPETILRPRISPVDLPPEDAVSVPHPTRRKGKNRIKTESSLEIPPTGTSKDGSVVVTYPYKKGAVYSLTVGVTHPITLFLPFQLHIAATPVLDTEDGKVWKVGYAKSGKEETYQEKIIVRPVQAGLNATTPILFDTGHFFFVRFLSQDKSGTLAATWELPEGSLPPVPSKVVKLQPQGQQPPKIALDRLHIQYKIVMGKTKVSWLPVEAYDDGNLTVIRFAESLKFTSAPVLVAPQGKRTIPIEYTVFAVPNHPERGEFYVTRGLYPKLQLRDGNGGIVTIIRLPSPQPQFVEKTP